MKSNLHRVVALFILSGATSLVYQSVWARQLHLVFGTSTFAISTVLAAFMGGLCAGGLLGAGLADSTRRPLRVYALLEAGIALFAMAFPWLLSTLKPLVSAGWSGGTEEPGSSGFWVGLVVSALLLAPTTAMGATLPLLARFAMTDPSRAGARLSLLYGVNTVGAVCGALVGGFVLLPALGITATTLVAVALNLGVAVLALVEDRRCEATVLGEVAPMPVRGFLVVLAMALGGFASMVDEVAWTRVLVLVLGPSVYAFSVMLVTYLLGIAVGGAVGGGLADRAIRRWGYSGAAALFAVTEIGIGLSSLALLRVARELPYWYVWLFDGLQARTDPVWLFVLSMVLSGVVLVPPALGIGAAFPMATRLVMGSGTSIGWPVGVMYGAASFGGAVGAFCAGFVLLPALEVRGTLMVAAGVNGVAAMLVLWGASQRLWAASAMAVVALGVLAAPRWDPRIMTAGTYHYLTRFSDHSREGILDSVVGDYELLLYDEGLSSVVTVGRNRTTGNLWLANNGKIDASSQGDLPTQILVALLPMTHVAPERVLVIGLASGITAGAASVFPTVKRLDIVEIEPGIEAAARLFGEHNHHVLDDPRTHLYLDDARHFVEMAPVGTWDIVVSEPSNPWISGVANLFTEDFLREGKERLTPGGVWAQWMQVYGLSPEDLRSLLATFAAVYPNVAVYSSNDLADILVLGSDVPLIPSLAGGRAILADEAVGAEFRRARIHNEIELAGLFILDRDAVIGATHGVELNTDDNMRIEFSAPLRLHNDLVERNVALLGNVMVVPDLVASQQEWERLAVTLGSWGHFRRAAEAKQRAQGFLDRHSDAWWASERQIRAWQAASQVDVD